MLVLPVQLDEARGRGRAARAAVASAPSMKERLRPWLRDLAADDQLAAVASLEDGFDGRLRLAGPDQVGGRAAAEQQADGLDEDRLAGAGLPGQDVEAGLELDLDGLDDRQVPDAEEAEHVRRNFHRIIRLTALRSRATLRMSALSQRRAADASEASLHTLGSLVLALQVQDGAAPSRLGRRDLVEHHRAGRSVINQAVLAILIVFSVASWAIILHKIARPTARSQRQTATFLDVFRRSSKFSEVQAVCPTLPASPLVGVFQAGYAELNAQFRLTRSGSRPIQARLPARPTAQEPRRRSIARCSARRPSR